MRGFRMVVVAGSLVAGGLVGAPAAAAGAAAGSMVYVDDGPGGLTFTYRAGAGQENNPSVKITPDGTEGAVYTINDVAAITPGAGCTRPDPADPDTARCAIPVLGPNHGAVLRLGDGVDRIDRLRADVAVAPFPGWVSVMGGTGDDVLIAGDWGYIDGEEGNDVITGREAYGEEGNDVMTAPNVAGAHHTLRAGPGNDTLIGGDGIDILDGGDGNDHLTGGRGDDYLTGGAGQDQLYGNSGKDDLLGGPGDDYLSGGPDDDTLYGNSGNDVLAGGAGHDFLSGGPGRDVERQ